MVSKMFEMTHTQSLGIANVRPENTKLLKY